ncbi:MAG: YcaQ family DNA glycosylase [Armatimonadetes bacterium]|nr:YcaQ family DNA glycosylase [Armatimonadota bacterium]
MRSPVQLSKADARRAMVRHHFALCATPEEAFHKLRSIQFDPIAPVGCNHDLVLQARVPGYKVGDWERLAYKDRHIYDGWDKQASLVPFEGWSVRRIFHSYHRKWFEQKIFQDHKEAVDLILKELSERGPLMPRDFDFQMRREEWKGHWHGPSVTKQTLRALWHSGLIMTSGRKSGQHVYDLTERVVPGHVLNQPTVKHDDAIRELVLDRHVAMGIVRPSAGPEIWSLEVLNPRKREAIDALVKMGKIVPVEVEGVKAHATPEFLSLLDQPSLEPRCVFVAPLDQFMWDRKMIAHLFGFDYIWEIYTPEAKRRWGYYVLPIVYGDAMVARVEFFCRDGVLELRRWHWEAQEPGPGFMEALELALREFMRYCSARKIQVEKGVDPKIRSLSKTIKLK